MLGGAGGSRSRLKQLKNGVVGTCFRGLDRLCRGVLDGASRGRVFVAEEGLIEVVDAGVEGGYAGAHFLPEFGQVLAQDTKEGDQ